ncbi:MAG TPA: hypothetical protein VD767_12335, partial [Thermomicrobiales bacterium]|nr:hypothetical protein [Thermomicrobiales bacterium]
ALDGHQDHHVLPHQGLGNLKVGLSAVEKLEVASISSSVLLLPTMAGSPPYGGYAEIRASLTALDSPYTPRLSRTSPAHSVTATPPVRPGAIREAFWSFDWEDAVVGGIWRTT